MREVKQYVTNHHNSATLLTQQLVFMALTAFVGEGVMTMEAEEINNSIKDLWPLFFLRNNLLLGYKTGSFIMCIVAVAFLMETEGLSS